MGVITFNGVSSSEFHIQVEHLPGYDSPKKDYEIVHVPGRNGDIVIDSGTYQNVQRKYEIAVTTEVKKPFYIMANDVVNWLRSSSGYARLEDSYEPEFYRKAFYEDEISVTNILGEAGRAEITFNCKPQRYLKSGEDIIEIDGSLALVNIDNPTQFDALPFIVIYIDTESNSAYGQIRINNNFIKVSNELGTGISSVTIDSELQDAYSGNINLNNKVSLQKGFPILLPGSNSIYLDEDHPVSKVEVIPRWWTL